MCVWVRGPSVENIAIMLLCTGKEVKLKLATTMKAVVKRVRS